MRLNQKTTKMSFQFKVELLLAFPEELAKLMVHDKSYAESETTIDLL